MNAMVQHSSGLLGSAEDIDALAASESAAVLVVSDTHGHYEVLESVIREFGPSCSALLFTGDGMWDIVQYIENSQESEKLRAAMPPVVAFVSGNGDGDQYRVSLPPVGDADDNPGYSLSVPSRQIVRAAGYTIFVAHGHRHSVDVSLDILVDSAHAMNCDIAVYGHTHVSMAEQFSHILALNPGSLSRPRGHSLAGFALMELDAISTEPRVSFYSAATGGIRGNFKFEEILQV
jgi:putative phosphoesterase